MKYQNYRELLIENGLKVTPQRIAVLEAAFTIENHPTAERIISFINEKFSGIAVGTIYKILETFVAKGIIKRVKTEREVMHYDAILENHHHLFCKESDKIEDYFDEELDEILSTYFKKKGIPGFEIDDIKLHINGRFKNMKS